MEKVNVSRLWVGHLEKCNESVELGLVLKTLRALDLNLAASLQKNDPFAETNDSPFLHKLADAIAERARKCVEIMA